MTRASELRERVTFRARSAPVSDGHGNEESEFADRFTVAARIRPKFGGEEVTAGRLAGRSIAAITVRYSSDTAQVSTDWEAQNARNGEKWNVRSVSNPDEKKAFLEMLCERGRD